MSIKKSIIPAAGLGTRLYPLTRTIPKVMLPVGLKPMIQYAVEEAVLSGIEEICIVVGQNSQSIVDYFTGKYSYDVKDVKDTNGFMEDILKKCTITFVKQPEPKGIADAISRAKGFVGDVSFAIIVPDALLFSDKPGLKQIIDLFEKHKHNCCGLMELGKIEEIQRLGNYGYVDYEALNGNAVKITKIYGKSEIPISFGVQGKRFLKTFGRSVNTLELFEFIEEVRRDLPIGTELDDIPVLQMLLQKVGRIGCVLNGEGFDVGTLSNYQYACCCLRDTNVGSSIPPFENRQGMTYVKAVEEKPAKNDFPVTTLIFNEYENIQKSYKRPPKLKFSVVIPVLNEQNNLKALYDRLTKVMSGLGESYEILFVDDGSTDSSFQILKDLHQKDTNVKVVRFTRNFGQAISRTAGLNYSKGENIILMDADLQDQPEEIPKLVSKLGEGYDIVYGNRMKRQDSFFKKMTSKIYLSLLAKLTCQTINPDVAPFRIMTRQVVDYMNEVRERNRYYSGLLAWLGFPYAVVNVEHGKRFAGQTKYSFWKRMNLAIEGIISFSDLPLRLITFFGFLVSGVSFSLGIYILIKQLVWGIAVSGFTTIIVSVSFTGGVLLIVLGIIGHYIGRIHIEVKKRPLYVIRDIVE